MDRAPLSQMLDQGLSLAEIGRRVERHEATVGYWVKKYGLHAVNSSTHAARCIAALHFHHRDPADKRFALSLRGVTRSLASARAEAEKCVLLCANCHAEVEAGVRRLP